MANTLVLIGAGQIGQAIARRVGAVKHVLLADRRQVKPYNIRTTVISPGAIATELPDSITEPDIAETVRKFVQDTALPAASFARAVAFAMSQPDDMDVNEILFRPTKQEL